MRLKNILSVVIQEMSSLRKFDVLDPDAEALLDKALTCMVK